MPMLTTDFEKVVKAVFKNIRPKTGPDEHYDLAILQTLGNDDYEIRLSYIKGVGLSAEHYYVKSSISGREMSVFAYDKPRLVDLLKYVLKKLVAQIHGPIEPESAPFYERVLARTCWQRILEVEAA